MTSTNFCVTEAQERRVLRHHRIVVSALPSASTLFSAPRALLAPDSDVCPAQALATELPETLPRLPLFSRRPPHLACLMFLADACTRVRQVECGRALEVREVCRA